MAVAPSFERDWRICSATNSPQAIPVVFCGPSGTVERMAVCSASNADPSLEKSVMSTRCAAADAAASGEALAGTRLGTEYESWGRLNSITASKNGESRQAQ